MTRERVLVWDGCVNVRDLGGLPLEGGGDTRFGAVVRADSLAGLTSRGWQALQDYGVRSLVRRSLRRFNRTSVPSPAEYSKPEISVAEYCRQHDIQLLTVESLDAPDDLVRIRALDPDLFVHAGAGIVRATTLAVPRLGTLNAHMGILPRYRGMNVAEWARFEGSPVGCSVHLIDAGIDTGDIACVQRVDVREVRTIAELRRRVDTAQIALLGEVVRRVAATGCLPARRRQEAGEGTQYFRMHPELAAILEAELPSPAPVLASVTD